MVFNYYRIFIKNIYSHRSLFILFYKRFIIERNILLKKNKIEKELEIKRDEV